MREMTVQAGRYAADIVPAHLIRDGTDAEWAERGVLGE
jgi:hypothetical protein